MSDFNFIQTGIKDLYLIKPEVFGDERGYFMETYSERDFQKAGLNVRFVQDNESRSVKGVLRGMHFQKKHPQGKLVRVTKGEIFDAAIDLRIGSETYGQWFGARLSSENKMMLYVPEGFAHGFLVLSDSADFLYKCTDFYHPEDESGVIWNDPDIGIEWPLDVSGEVKLSQKDKLLKTFDEIRKSELS